MIVAKFLHILGFTVWIGGMFFAYVVLRTVATSRFLRPELRLPLWEGVFGKFFPWVWLSVGLILGSGLHMMTQIGEPPMYVSTMSALGVLMMLIFAHIFFAPYKRLKRAVAAEDWKAGSIAIGDIRMLIRTNLASGW